MEIYDDGKKPFITPLGVAKFPALVQPDTQFDKPHGVYKVDLILTPAESIVVEAKAKEAAEKYRQEDLKNNPSRKSWGIHLPILPDLNKEKEETGMVIARFKQKAKIATRDGRLIDKSIMIHDAQGNRVTGVDPRGGSKIHVAYYMLPYAAPTTRTYGITFRLVAVQIIELVESSQREVGFTPKEGYVQPKQEAIDHESEIQGQESSSEKVVFMESEEEDTTPPPF